MSASKLTRPGADWRASFLDALAEFQAEGRYDFLNAQKAADTFDVLVEQLRTGQRHIHHPRPDWVEPVPETTLWLVKGQDFIGSINIRHRLNWHLERWGGHMNFVVRPSWRGKGFGKKLLRKALPAAAQLGVERALLTVRPDNAAAIATIVACGGVFEDATEATERFPARRRYWISCEG